MIVGYAEDTKNIRKKMRKNEMPCWDIKIYLFKNRKNII